MLKYLYLACPLRTISPQTLSLIEGRIGCREQRICGDSRTSGAHTETDGYSSVPAQILDGRAAHRLANFLGHMQRRRFVTIRDNHQEFFSTVTPGNVIRTQ